MSDLGQFQGQWLGAWHGAVGEPPVGFVSGSASFTITATGTLTAVQQQTVARGRPKESHESAATEWHNRDKWRKQAESLFDEPVQKPVQKAVPESVPETIAIDEILPRLYEPIESLAELVADAKLLRLDEARALESAIAVRDVLAIAEMAYLAEVAVQQEKDAIAAFIMFMD